mmetsp:Transcript_57597/g.160441  ORF Transcript_57597/g.160441 Transcript_57597/m.160441 type:complete len:209 (+) Transcript_57597:407-1033(+)
MAISSISSNARAGSASFSRRVAELSKTPSNPNFANSASRVDPRPLATPLADDDTTWSSLRPRGVGNCCMARITKADGFRTSPPFAAISSTTSNARSGTPANNALVATSSKTSPSLCLFSAFVSVMSPLRAVCLIGACCNGAIAIGMTKSCRPPRYSGCSLNALLTKAEGFRTSLPFSASSITISVIRFGSAPRSIIIAPSSIFAFDTP